jgi:hypothetical protein
MRNLAKVSAFLNDIGLPTIEDDHVDDGQITGIRIVQGVLHYDARALAADLLHEAGHLAIVPTRFRSWLDDDVSIGVCKMVQCAMDEQWEPDSPQYRAVIQTGDTEATAWAWAAGEHLGLLPHEIINTRDPKAYDGDAVGVIIMMQMRAYLGIHGLQHAGFCRAKHWGFSTLPVYPKLAFWLQA